jgi:16S rRNA (cytosine1402-N4)-methyltransferase
MADNIHISVLLSETLEVLGLTEGGTYIDATVGLGGHSEAILDKLSHARLIGIDTDKEALALASSRLAKFGDRSTLIHANFAELKQVLIDCSIDKVDGVIADLGVSSLQFDSDKRGFSFRFDAPLDMRMDGGGAGPTAAELLTTLSQDEIANLIYLYGEERHSRRIARRIVEKREQSEPVTTTKQLVELVERSVRRSKKDKIHPATRTFQALRIAVNHEVEILEKFILDAVDSLKVGGRFAVITFHSLEDRIVKHTFQKLSGKCFCPPRMPVCVCGAKKVVEIVTRKPIIPSEAEERENPRSRSAKLRAVRRISE